MHATRNVAVPCMCVAPHSAVVAVTHHSAQQGSAHSAVVAVTCHSAQQGSAAPTAGQHSAQQGSADSRGEHLTALGAAAQAKVLDDTAEQDDALQDVVAVLRDRLGRARHDKLGELLVRRHPLLVVEARDRDNERHQVLCIDYVRGVD